MEKSGEEIGAWQRGLEAAFDPWHELNRLELAESQHRDAARERSQGFLALIRSYQDFALLTLEEATTQGVPIDPFNIALHRASVRRFRTGFLAYLAGYYFDAASTLRTVLEITMYLAAVLKEHIPFDELLPPDPDTDVCSTDPQGFKKRQQKKYRELSTKIKSLIYGEESGLSETSRKYIELHMTLLHMDVHRGESNVIHDVLDLVQAQSTSGIVPGFDPHRASMYCNGAALAAWTHTRTLPFLLMPGRFSDLWQRKYDLLDRSFCFYIDGWEKPMRSAFLELMKVSFSFELKRTDSLVEKAVS